MDQYLSYCCVRRFHLLHDTQPFTANRTETSMAGIRAGIDSVWSFPVYSIARFWSLEVPTLVWLGARFFANIARSIGGMDTFPKWAWSDLYSAVSSTIKQLIPTVLMIWLLGYRPAEAGITHPHWKLTAILVSVTAVFGLLTGVLFM